MNNTTVAMRVGDILARVAFVVAPWIVAAIQPRPPVAAEARTVIATPPEAPARPSTEAPPEAVWKAAAIRTLASDHHSFGAAVRRFQNSGDTCSGRELLVVNGYDHVPQYLARIDFRAAGGRCVPETTPRRWSPRALHYSDIAVADFDGDGLDELVVAAFAEADGRMHGGSVRVVPGADPWLVDPPALAIGAGLGFAPASVAIGDVDADGRLDIVVGSLWSGALGTGRDVKHIRGGELDGPTFVFRGTTTIDEFSAPILLAARGVLDVKLVDVDLDGALDIVSAGRAVTIHYGPAFIDVRTLPLAEGMADAVALSLDVALLPDRQRTLVAFTTSCFSADECTLGALGGRAAFGASVWSIATHGSDKPRAESPIGFWPTPGIPSPVRFGDIDEDALPDLLVGLMSIPSDAGLLVPVVGRPWLGPLGLVGAAPLLLPGNDLMAEPPLAATAWQALSVRAPAPAFPMTSAIVPYVDARDAYPVIGEPESGHAVLSYSGPGQVVAAQVHTAAGDEVPIHIVTGDPFVTLVEPSAKLLHTDLTVTWHIVRHPHIILTSACPLAGPAAGTLFTKPPERVRSSHVATREGP